MSSMRRITLVIHALGGGGAERVLAGMANHWVSEGHSVTLVTLDDGAEDAYDVDARVQRVALGVMRDSSHGVAAVGNNLGRLRSLRRALRRARPDFVIAFTDQICVLTLLATLGWRVPVIISERADPRRHPLGRAWRWLRACSYRRCWAAVAQTDSVGDWLRPLVRGRPVYVIPNAVPLPAEDERQRANELRERRPTGEHTIVAAGRLEHQKGFDLLVDAFAQLPAASRAAWRLVIFGEGSQRVTLTDQIERRGLRDRVRLPGWTDKLGVELAAADLLVLPSRYEGFPNVLLEAMARGLPVVASDAPCGPAEIVRDGIDGLLVPKEDAAELARAIAQLIDNEPLRARMGERAVEVVSRYSKAEYFRRWAAVFERQPPPDASPSDPPPNSPPPNSPPPDSPPK